MFWFLGIVYFGYCVFWVWVLIGYRLSWEQVIHHVFYTVCRCRIFCKHRSSSACCGCAAAGSWSNRVQMQTGAGQQAKGTHCMALQRLVINVLLVCSLLLSSVTQEPHSSLHENVVLW